MDRVSDDVLEEMRISAAVSVDLDIANAAEWVSIATELQQRRAERCVTCETCGLLDHRLTEDEHDFCMWAHLPIRRARCGWQPKEGDDGQ